MTSRLKSFVTLVTAAVMLTGCVTDNSMSDEQYYESPALGHKMPTSITGSKDSDHGFFQSKPVGYVIMVDGNFIRNARENWDHPIILSAGTHTVVCEYHHSYYQARVTFTLEARAGISYEVRVTPVTEDINNLKYCDFTIVNSATGIPRVPIKRARVTGAPSKINYTPLD